jgi:hypothetical protein
MPERPLSKDSFVDQDEQNLYSDAKFRRRSRQISRILRIKAAHVSFCRARRWANADSATRVLWQVSRKGSLVSE